MRIGKGLAALAAGWTLAAAGLAVAAAPDEARIHDGRLKGVVADGVASFKSIPFAAPPVGPLRWRAPQAPARWAGVRDANQFGPSCLQMSNAAFGAAANQSEDCLTINVFTPAHRSGAKLPVMVWIYGGAFTQGGSARYDGTHFAQDGVVLVTFNYRLGRLGFFAHPALLKTNPEGTLANYGMMDQIAALKWVRRNIAAFGGDPRRVTVFGESAGGISVNYLMISPAARGLFAQAASESGFGRSQPRPLDRAESAGADFIKTLGVTGDDAKTAAAMRALPASALQAPTKGIGDPTSPSPILDNVVIREGTGDGFARGHQARVPYLVGGNSFEASLFRDALAHPEVVISRFGDKRDAAIQLYGGGDPAKAAANVTTLTAVIEPDRFLAREDNKVGVPAYVYYFSYVPQAQRATSMGVMHGGEIGYVFEMLPKTPIDRGPFHIPAATDADQQVAKETHAYWVAFAKTGHPGAAGGVNWPQSGANDTVLEIGSDGIAARPDFDQPRLDPITRKADGVAP